jgi:tetrapyrrole methylase family protein / MazG family protein
MAGSITVAGLGPGDPGALTLAASDAFDRAGRIILRTAIHPSLTITDDPRTTVCDDLYEALPTFDEVYAAVVERVIDAAKDADGEIVYAVPGHPRFGERTIDLLLTRAAEERIPVRFLPAVSYVDAVANALGVDPMASGLQLLDALDLQAAIEADPFSGGQFAIDPTRPLLVGQVYDDRAAAETKLRLARTYPDDHPIIMLTAAGVPDAERIIRCALFELDRTPVDYLTSVWVPPLADLAASRSAATLQRIAARLRREDGCPWDRKQTHASLRQAVIEEAYEVVDAIDASDPGNLAEELGDLLLQVALHTQIAEEAGEFTLEDVYAAVNEKLVRRHPHVFGDVVARTPGEVVQTWESVKAREREAAGKEAERPAHPLDRLPRSMPALQRARTLLGPRKGDSALDADPGALAAAGATILAAVEQSLVQGIDPEQALEHALRLRFAPTPEATEPEGTDA